MSASGFGKLTWGTPSWAYSNPPAEPVKPKPLFPGPLTREALLEAMYCCSPIGYSQLISHLHWREATFTGEELQALLGQLVNENKVYQRTVPLFTGVTLFTLPGYGL